MKKGERRKSVLILGVLSLIALGVGNNPTIS